jgi:DNA-directed RNA polymerase subunit RPC12/RpoP
MPSPTDPIQFACSNCGAQLSVDGSTQTPTCIYC